MYVFDINKKSRCASLPTTFMIEKTFHVRLEKHIIIDVLFVVDSSAIYLSIYCVYEIYLFIPIQHINTFSTKMSRTVSAGARVNWICIHCCSSSMYILCVLYLYISSYLSLSCVCILVQQIWAGGCFALVRAHQ